MKYKNFMILIFTIFIVSIITIIYCVPYRVLFMRNNINNQLENNNELTDTTSVEYHLKDSILDYMKSINLSNINVVYSQALIESGHFTSNVFIENNNMFGMKKAYYRPHFQEDYENRGYAVYQNWKRSIDDYALLQAWSYKNLSNSEYIDKLHRIYAESDKYLQLLTEMSKNEY